jgi:hypothetical protein
MNRNRFFSALLGLGTLAASPCFATTATSTSSFGGIEEPAVIYHPSSNSFTNDSFVNITNVSSGTIQVLLRYSSSSWDGDRTTSNTDRQRGEVKTLGAHQLIHETYEYTTTWKTNSGFKGSGSFCHITQLKSVDGAEGSSGAPLIVTSIASGTSSANVRYASASFSPTNVFTAHTVRNITWAPATSLSEKIRVKTTGDGGSDGFVTVSINGDSFQGVTNVEVCRPQSTEYYPKWGLYRGASTSSGFSANDFVQHSSVSASKVSSTPPPSVTAQAESMSPVGSGATTSTTSDTSAGGGVLLFLNSDGVGDTLTLTTPSLQAGTYQVKFTYKSNNSRGQHTVKIDGTQIGGTVDQYASTQGYVTVTLGSKTFSSAGTHTIVLSVTGKNASSSNYILSADQFQFVGQ